MGNACEKTTDGIADTYKRIDVKQFVRVNQQKDSEYASPDSLIGFGGFAVVHQVRRKGDNTDYAMKTIDKLLISQQKCINPTINEMLLLRDIQHPFLIDMKWAFSDQYSLYLVMKHLKGKDLRFHLKNFKLRQDSDLLARMWESERKKAHLFQILHSNTSNIDIKCLEQKEKVKIDPSSFSENQTRFIILQICLALNYLHHKNIMHRDIKPENVLFEEDGYLSIIDFGIAKKYEPNNSYDNSGTIGYMAPEVLCRQNHNFSVDYYAVGIMTYEMMLNRRPYEKDEWYDKKDFNFRNELLKQILSFQVLVKPYAEVIEKTEEKVINDQKFLLVQAPKEWSTTGIDFINKCLKRKPTDRIGYSNVDEVLSHPWFQNIDFETLLAKKYTKIPFSNIHISRSFQRYKIMKPFEDMIVQVEQRIEKIRLTRQLEKEKKERLEQLKLEQQNKVIALKERSIFDDAQHENQSATWSEDASNSGGPSDISYAIMPIAPVVGLALNQAKSPNQEEIELNKMKLNSIQYLFKHYYFDRERYNYELNHFHQQKLLKSDRKQQTLTLQHEIQNEQKQANSNYNLKQQPRRNPSGNSTSLGGNSTNRSSHIPSIATPGRFAPSKGNLGVNIALDQTQQMSTNAVSKHTDYHDTVYELATIDHKQGAGNPHFWQEFPQVPQIQINIAINKAFTLSKKKDSGNGSLTDSKIPGSPSISSVVGISNTQIQAIEGNNNNSQQQLMHEKQKKNKLEEVDDNISRKVPKIHINPSSVNIANQPKHAAVNNSLHIFSQSSRSFSNLSQNQRI